MCGRATNVILAPSPGCKGFARRSVTSVPARKADKAEQVRRIPGSSVSIGMSCRNFACWLPKIGLLLGIFHAPRTENAPYGYERLGAPSENAPSGYARKKKESLDRWWPAVHQSCAQIQRLKALFFCHWAPTPAPEPSPGLRLCRGIAAALPARNSRAPARLLEAAELLEADQRKHDGGQSKKKKKKKKKKIKIERSTSGTIYAKCTLPDRPPTAAN